MDKGNIITETSMDIYGDVEPGIVGTKVIL
jgi:hypothetical protein